MARAFRFAANCHQGQARDSGEPYMVHTIMVSHILADMRMNAAGLVRYWEHRARREAEAAAGQPRPSDH